MEDAIEFAGFHSGIPHCIARLHMVVHASMTGKPFRQLILEGRGGGQTSGGYCPAASHLKSLRTKSMA
jgi:hypothetical protein